MFKTVTHEFIEKGRYMPPRGARYLIIGTFPSVIIKKAFGRFGEKDAYFYYGSRVNGFWDLLGDVYGVDLRGRGSVKAMRRILKEKKIALTDIIYKCRTDGGSGDDRLKIIRKNPKLGNILKKGRFKTIYFTGHLARTLTLKHLKRELRAIPEDEKLSQDAPRRIEVFGKPVKIVTLCSPSRRAAVPYRDKLRRYKKYLPR